MIYSSPAASASDLWDDTLWKGFLRAGESGFQLVPWGNVTFKDMLCSSVEIMTQRWAGGWGCLLNAMSGDTAVEGRLFLFFHVHIEQRSTAQKHWGSNTSSGEYLTHSIIFPSRNVSWESATLLVPMLAQRAILGVSSLPCIVFPFWSQFVREPDRCLCQNKHWISDPDRPCY